VGSGDSQLGGTRPTSDAASPADLARELTRSSETQEGSGLWICEFLPRVLDQQGLEVFEDLGHLQKAGEILDPGGAGSDP
jgi:hypothetical protein